MQNMSLAYCGYMGKVGRPDIKAVAGVNGESVEYSMCYDANPFFLEPCSLHSLPGSLSPFPHVLSSGFRP